jgi:sterol desaturase/sphingolipid hydroxylase (fatty acid hydroxylase superfamily)
LRTTAHGSLTQLAMNLPALVLGLELSGLAWLIVFRGVWAAFIHSNVRRPICPLRYLIGAPELHHWHHARAERTEHNFSNLAPWTDLVFDTYHCPPHQRHVLGIPVSPYEATSPGWCAPARELCEDLHEPPTRPRPHRIRQCARPR